MCPGVDDSSLLQQSPMPYCLKNIPQYWRSQVWGHSASMVGFCWEPSSWLAHRKHLVSSHGREKAIEPTSLGPEGIPHPALHICTLDAASPQAETAWFPACENDCYDSYGSHRPWFRSHTSEKLTKWQFLRGSMLASPSSPACNRELNSPPVPFPYPQFPSLPDEELKQ